MASPVNRGRWNLPTPKAPWGIVADFLRNPTVWQRLGIYLAATTLLYIIMFGWIPAFPYRNRLAPLRDLHARTAFQAIDYDATGAARQQARQNFPNYYVNKPRPLDEIRQGLIDQLFEVKQKSFAELQTENLWPRFLEIDQETGTYDPKDDTQKEFERFKNALVKDETLDLTTQILENAFVDIRRRGLLRSLEHELGNGSMQEIQVYQGDIEDAISVDVSDVRRAEALEKFRTRLRQEFSRNAETIPEPILVADRVFNWFKPRLPNTLTWDDENSRRGQQREASVVENRLKDYQPGDYLEKLNYRGVNEPKIRAFEPLDEKDILLLRQEHDAFVANYTLPQRLVRTASFYFLFFAVGAIVCGYLYYRDNPLLSDVRHFAMLIGLIVVALATAWMLCYRTDWRAEIIPMVFFAIIVAIAYRIELSIFLSAIVALILSVNHGYGLGEFMILTTACSTAALLCGSIRSRTKLVYVGFIVAAVIFPTILGVQYLLGQPMGQELVVDASWFAMGALVAGIMVTALLPFLEFMFDLQTDISLLELSDANHPLLKELVQRAPGTYNHSINVASIAEAAADSIGANGLLCRVGAYFHDVGKLRKPEYFIENQGGGENKHDDLNPAMSTLVIIAHVKEGAEIGRQHNLPQRIIDLIEQHHGTTLVSYFFDRATKQSEKREDLPEVNEVDFRYPGPKPQSLEAAVMMLADAVESASRALREPTPSRIENLVNDIAKKRLDDGQFDECDLSLRQLHTIQQNLIKSLNAMYHARVKYPDQQSA